MPQNCGKALARGAFNVFTVGECRYSEVNVAEQLEFFPIQSPCRGFVRWMSAVIAVGVCVPATSGLTGKISATRKSKKCFASAASGFCAKYVQTSPVKPKNPSNLHCFNTLIAYTHDITSLRKMLWFSVLPLPQGARILRFVMGYWRLMDWNMSPAAGELH